MRFDKFSILHFFNDLIDLSLRNPGPPGWGNACSHLIEKLIIRQEYIIKMIQGNDGDFDEFRLNGAGLKIHWRVRDERFFCYINGDQVNMYPQFVEKANQLIRERGCYHR